MKRLLKIIILAAIYSTFCQASYAQSCPRDRSDYFCISPEMAPDSLITQTLFYTIPVTLISEFKVSLELDAKWESPYFGAGVSFFENRFRLMILGGTTRIKGMTLDAYAAIVCHELGHIIGGAPFQTIYAAEWSSSEGQADFFAASVCLPRYFKKLGVRDDEISKRVEQAGFEMITAFMTIEKGDIERFKKDETVVNETLVNNYPTLQCRYENFRDNSKKPSCWFKK